MNEFLDTLHNASDEAEADGTFESNDAVDSVANENSAQHNENSVNENEQSQVIFLCLFVMILLDFRRRNKKHNILDNATNKKVEIFLLLLFYRSFSRGRGQDS